MRQKQRQTAIALATGLAMLVGVAPVSADPIEMIDRLFAHPPANDNFADAIPITELPYEEERSSFTMGSELGEPLDCPLGEGEGELGSIWYKITLPTDTVIQVEHSNYRFGLYEGDSLATLTELKCGGGDSRRNILRIRGGNTYYLRFADLVSDQPEQQEGRFGMDVEKVPSPFTSKVAGRVTDLEGTPLPGMCVYADTRFEYSYSKRRVRTDSNGDYEIYGLSAWPSGHTILFTDCTYVLHDRPGPPSYVWEYYDDKPRYEYANGVAVRGFHLDREALTLTYFHDRTGVDAALAPREEATG